MMPHPTIVKAHRLRDFKLEGWISFDAVTWNEHNGLV